MKPCIPSTVVVAYLNIDNLSGNRQKSRVLTKSHKVRYLGICWLRCSCNIQYICIILQRPLTKVHMLLYNAPRLSLSTRYQVLLLRLHICYSYTSNLHNHILKYHHYPSAPMIFHDKDGDKRRVSWNCLFAGQSLQKTKNKDSIGEIYRLR